MPHTRSPMPPASGPQEPRPGRAPRAVRFRRGKALGVALVLAVTVLAGAPASGIDGDSTGPLNPLGFPLYYADDAGTTLRLCIDETASCLGAARRDLRDTADGEAFYWMAVAELPTRRGTLDVEMALEAAYGPPGTPIVFDRLRIRGHLDRAGRYLLKYPYGQRVLVAGRPSEQRNVNVTLDRPCSLTGGSCGRITDFLRSVSLPTGYVGMGDQPTRVTGGSQRNWVSLVAPSGHVVGTTHRFAVVGKVSDDASSVVSPTRVSFGNTLHRRTRTVRVHNAGDLPLDLHGLRARGSARISLRRTGCVDRTTLAVGDTCRATLVYRPGAARSVTARLVVRDSSKVTRHRIPVTAYSGPAVTAPDLVHFRDRRARTESRARKVRIRNTGVRDLRILRVSAGRSFQLRPGSDRCRRGVRLEPGESCLARVAFTPRSRGLKTARLTVRSDAVDAPTRVLLDGRAR